MKPTRNDRLVPHIKARIHRIQAITAFRNASQHSHPKFAVVVELNYDVQPCSTSLSNATDAGRAANNYQQISECVVGTDLTAVDLKILVSID
jgi:hypothetical protein